MSSDSEPLLPDDGSTNMCGCTKSNGCRKLFINITTSTAFDMFILLVIIINCGMMAMQSPLDPKDTPRALLFGKIGYVFNIIFTIEMFMKIIAQGLLTYLGDGWNLLDVTVVTTAWAPILFPGVGNYTAIRAVRVLRALRTVNRIPSLKKIIRTLLSAIPEVRTRPCVTQWQDALFTCSHLLPSDACVLASVSTAATVQTRTSF